jgi:hypothetical protein
MTLRGGRYGDASMPLSARSTASSAAAVSPILGTDDATALPLATNGLSTLAGAFVGAYCWSASDSGSLLDFEHVDFRADGTYVAKVEATLVNPRVRCSRFPFTLPEEGLWSSFKVAATMKLRVRPSTGRSRVYVIPISDDEHSLTLSRRGVRTKLFRDARGPSPSTSVPSLVDELPRETSP